MRFVVVIVGCLMGISALACQPPPDQLYTQPAEIEAVLNTYALKELRDLGGKDIASIRRENGQYIVESSNGCYIKSEVMYVVTGGDRAPGRCPGLKGAYVMESDCK